MRAKAIHVWICRTAAARQSASINASVLGAKSAKETRSARTGARSPGVRTAAAPPFACTAVSAATARYTARLDVCRDVSRACVATKTFFVCVCRIAAREPCASTTGSRPPARSALCSLPVHCAQDSAYVFACAYLPHLHRPPSAATCCHHRRAPARPRSLCHVRALLHPKP